MKDIIKIVKSLEESGLLIKRISETIKNKAKEQKRGCFDKLDDTVNKYNNAGDSTTNMKPVDVKSNTYIDSSKEINDKNSKFKIVDNVRISDYKYVFAKGYTPNWSEEIFMIKKVKNAVPWTYVTNDLNGE